MARLVYQRKNGKWEARYRKGKNAAGKVLYGTVYGDSESEAIARRIEILGYDPEADRRQAEMNLLILGAGVHGHDCAEIARSLRIFKRISFLDDRAKGPDVLGTMGDLAKARHNYPCAFVAIGDNGVRKRLVARLRELNFLLPSLISPDANISPNAVLGDGVVAFPRCSILEAAVGDFSIIDTGTVINSGAALGAYTRVDCGGIVLKGTAVPDGTLVKSGEIFGDRG